MIPASLTLLAQVRRRSLAAYENQDVPFEVLVERLNPTRSLTHHPLVQVMLAWQNWQDNGPVDPAVGLALGDLQVTPLPLDTRTARMDLSISLAERWSEAGDPAGMRRGGGIPHRRVRRGNHRNLGRAVGAGVGRHDHRSGAGGCRRSMCSMRPSAPVWTR